MAGMKHFSSNITNLSHISLEAIVEMKYWEMI
jgi:hypothetical protein